MEVNSHHAKTHPSKVIAAAKSGEEVIIARTGKPAVKLVLVTPPVRRSRKHMLGSGIGKLVAQALREGLPLPTDDARLKAYGVKVLW